MIGGRRTGGRIWLDTQVANRLLSAFVSSRLLLPAILFVAFAVYAPTLDDYFMGDDFWFLHSAHTIPLRDYVRKSFDFRETGTLPEFNRYRPLYPIAWRLQYEAFGLNPLGYHIVLLALHLGATALVWKIAFRLTETAWVARLATLIFAIHPGYFDAVAGLSAGNRVFATVPYLLSLLLFMKYLGDGRRRTAYYVGASMAFVLAALMHPAALSLALVLPAYQFLVAGSPGDAFRARNWIAFAPFFSAAVALTAILLWVRMHLGLGDTFKFGWHQYAMYGQYLGAALCPVFAVHPAQWPGPLVTLLRALQGVASVVMLAACAALLAQRRRPYAGPFAVLWLIAALFPDSTLPFQTQGRILYLPGASIALVLASTLLMLRQKLPTSVTALGRRAVLILTAVVFASSLALLSLYVRQLGREAALNEAFVAQLRADVPRLSKGSTLYVIGAPLNLIVFNDSSLDRLVKLYLGQVEVRSIGVTQAARLSQSLRPGDRIFWFQP
jgi:hypothetical protein